jgi:dethiobiotin synthetase
MKYFVSGIHTDAGKSYCTGWYARKLMDEGKSVITQKFIQTGNVGMSEDIEVHRRLMGTGYLPEDESHITAPVIFTHPCSPQLAARLDHRDIDLSVIDNASAELEKRYDTVLIEGAGGLMVPITDEFMTIDYITTRKLPLIMVVNSTLGSINHAILSFEAIKNRGIDMPLVLYNTYFDTDPLIAEDTFGFISRYLSHNFPATTLRVVPAIK